MNYPESLSYLEKIQDKGAEFALINIRKAVNHLPFDIHSIKFIQVAGTNGKGSTSHFITSILQSAGYRVGLFTSPHLQDIRERITIDKKWISEKEFSNSATAVKKICEQMLKKKQLDRIPTFFEHLLLIALHDFHIRKVDFAVLEVGLGGRLDATTAITPEVSIITNVSHDHTQTLGKRIRDIAAEKAGIIKKNIPVVSGCIRNSISRKIIQSMAEKKGSPFYDVLISKNALGVEEKPDGYQCTYETESNRYEFEIHLNGKHQAKNAATAIRTIEVLIKNGCAVSRKALYSGVKNNFVPGRIETIHTSPEMILDGGHNVDGIRVLTQFLNQKKLKNFTLIFGVLRDKNYRKMISLLDPFVRDVVITEPISDRAVPAEKLVKFFNHTQVQVKKNIPEAWETAKKRSGKILVTGSLYLAGEMRNIIFRGAKNE